MGYRPLPPPGARRIVGRRTFLRSVPGPDSGLNLLGRLDVEMEVLPYKNKWEWRVWLTWSGRRDPGLVQGASWRRGAHELRGRCRNQGDAWARARSIANDVRAIHAAARMTDAQRYRQRLPL